MKLLKTFNKEHVSDTELGTFRRRISMRAIIQDSDANIALVYSTKLKFYELPGGGVDKGETVEQATIRECKEETGCNVEILREVGKTLEVKKEDGLTNEAFCYVVKIVGEKKSPELNEDEAEEGLVVEWVSIKKARELINQRLVAAKRLYQRYMAERALIFIDEAFK